MGGSPGVYIYNIQKQIYIYIYIDANATKKPRRPGTARKGTKGPRRPTKSYEGPRRATKAHSDAAGVLQKAAANAANVLRTLGLRGGPDLSRRILPPNLWPANARERPRTPRTPRLEGLGAGAGAGAGGAGAGAGAGAGGWAWGWVWG